MTKPTEYPEWASDGTQIIEPSAGKKANGHLSGEQAIPQYENWRANNVYKWIQYLDGYNTGPVWQWFLPLGRSGADTNITWSDVSATATANPGPGLIDSIIVHTKTGDTIKGIGARILGTGAGGNVTVHLYKNAGNGTGRSTVATLTITTPPATWTTYTLTTLTEVVADQTGYTLDVEMPTTNQVVALVGVQIAPPG